MNLNNRALMISTGIGVVVRLIFALLGGALGFAPLMMDPNNIDASTGLLATVGIVGSVLCVCGWIITLGIGFSYAYFAKPVEMGSAAAGGAIATGVSGLIGGLLSACLGVVTPMAVSQVDAGTALASGIGGVAGAVCGGLILGALIGALGGVIGAATVGKQAA
jgi:hypothetical protein